MNMHLTAEQTITVYAKSEYVWDALINPLAIKLYRAGAEAVSDWQKGSSLVFRGVYEGSQYESKGTITSFEPGKRLCYTYWSSCFELPDTPENYSIVEFDIEPVDRGQTKLSYRQYEFKSKMARDHSRENWHEVLLTIKNIVEAQPVR